MSMADTILLVVIFTLGGIGVVLRLRYFYGLELNKTGDSRREDIGPKSGIQTLFDSEDLH